MKFPWQLSSPVPPEVFSRIRRRAIFECCKWDPQVEDVVTLSALPLVLLREEWNVIAALAEDLSAETLAAECELAQRPDLHGELGLSRPVRKALRAAAEALPSRAAARLLRFDFHFTTNGWRISEVNSDVPGGFNEASGFTRLMASEFPGWIPAGDPAGALAESIVSVVRPGGTAALVHATAFTDDRQVMVFLARELEKRGVQPVLVAPDHLRWRNGLASVASDWCSLNVDLVFRFFPAEWLPNLPSACGWTHYYAGGRTPLSSPSTSLLTQTKRFPLVWDRLSTPLPTWRRLLPETRDPREANWRGDPDWVLKPACGRVGDMIGLHGVTSPREWLEIRRSVRWHPRYWAVQRRFHTRPLPGSDIGPMYPCLGVFTIDGRVAGAYGRVAPTPLINHLAQDAAVLIEPVRPASRRPPLEHLYEPIGAV